MATFTIIGSYGNGTVVDGPENTAEFNNIYDAFNGTSTDKELHHKFSGANPSLIIDQLGAGVIARFRQNGSDKLVIDNAGKIVNANVIVDKYQWYVDVPTTLSTDPQERKVFIVPAGNTMRITKFSIIRHGGSHTSGKTITYRLRNISTASDIGSGVSFDNTNNAVDTEYSEALNVALTAGHIIGITQVTHDVGATETQVTLLMEWEQRLG